MKLFTFFFSLTISLLFISCDKEDTTCIDPDQINLDAPITLDYNPVCGCNGITYSNIPSAKYYGGVTSWTQGPCAEEALPCDSATIFTTHISSDCGLILENESGQFFEVILSDPEIEFWGGEEIAIFYESLPILGSCSGYPSINITGFCDYNECIPILHEASYLSPYWADPVQINSVELIGTCLNINLTYSGGCSAHLFRLSRFWTWCGTPPTPSDLTLDHADFDDACDALITRTISFDLSVHFSEPNGTISIPIKNSSDPNNNFTIIY